MKTSNVGARLISPLFHDLISVIPIPSLYFQSNATKCISKAPKRRIYLAEFRALMYLSLIHISPDEWFWRIQP